MHVPISPPTSPLVRPSRQLSKQAEIDHSSELAAVAEAAAVQAAAEERMR